MFPLAPSIGWLFAARFIDRIGKGIRGAPRDALIADIAPPDLRGASFGLRQSLDTIGAFLGPLLAIGLMVLDRRQFHAGVLDRGDPGVPVVRRDRVRRARAGAAGGSARRCARRSRAAEIGRLGTAFWIVVALGGMFTLARFSEAFLLLRAQSVGLALALVPVMLVVMNVVYALSAWPAGALSDRIGRFGVLAAGFAMLIVADLVLAFAPNVAAVALGAALWGLHMGLTQGILASLVADTAPRRSARHGLRHVQSRHRHRDARRQRDRRRAVGCRSGRR